MLPRFAEGDNLAPAPGIESQRTCCCIAGGGPAGMMLGFLLARAGVDVMVLEVFPQALTKSAHIAAIAA